MTVWRIYAPAAKQAEQCGHKGDPGNRADRDRRWNRGAAPAPVVLRQQVDGSHASVLDSESDCDRERTDLLSVLDLLAHLDPREGITRADVDTDQRLKLLG